MITRFKTEVILQLHKHSLENFINVCFVAFLAAEGSRRQRSLSAGDWSFVAYVTTHSGSRCYKTIQSSVKDKPKIYNCRVDACNTSYYLMHFKEQTAYLYHINLLQFDA